MSFNQNDTNELSFEDMEKMLSKADRSPDQSKIDSNAELKLKGLIRDRVEELLARKPDLLMSYLYRLDVDEHRIQSVLNNFGGEDILTALADLIWKRQMQRVESKKQYKTKSRPEDDLSWP